MDSAEKATSAEAAALTTPTTQLPELTPPPSGPSPAFVDPAPWTSPGPPLQLPAASSAASNGGGSAPSSSPAVRSPRPSPLSAGPEESLQAPAANSLSFASLEPRPFLAAAANARVDPALRVQHLRVPAISSRSYRMGPCPPTEELSRGFRDGAPVVVPLQELERDQCDMRPFLSESMVHFDSLGQPRFRTLLGEQTLDSGDLRAHLDSSGAVPLWSCSAAGVEFVVSCALPPEDEELRRLSHFFSKCRLHIVPGARVVQKPGSPACAWSNRDWCIGCGGEWHPLALCPLVVRVVREMLEKGMEVNFDDGFCMKCGFVGHTAGYCQARLDKTMYRVWLAFCARKRRWSCLDKVYPDIQLPPLSKFLQAEGCTRELPLPERRSPPLPLCVRCSRPTGEARELLQEVLDRERKAERERARVAQLEDEQGYPVTPASALTRLPRDLRLPEPAELALKEPVRLLTCVSTWQNWLAFGSQELQVLGHQLIWQVRRCKEIPFGGFPELGFRLPKSLELHVPEGADIAEWVTGGGSPSPLIHKRSLPPVDPPRSAPRRRGSGEEGRRSSAASHTSSSRSSGGRDQTASSRRVVSSGIVDIDDFFFPKE